VAESPDPGDQVMPISIQAKLSTVLWRMWITEQAFDFTSRLWHTEQNVAGAVATAYPFARAPTE